MPSGISVVICCFNSTSRITPTLQHLLNQEGISLSAFEVIIVDNASTDNTREIAALVWNNFDADKPIFKVVDELTPGLSAARKKGIEEARFDYVLFCDDDNWLDENYLSTSLMLMQSDPLIGALGGTGSPVFEGMEPPYFWVNQFHTLAVGRQSGIEGDITNERGVLYGAGMIVNKKAFTILKEKYQFQFLVSDRMGNSLASSGDHELCLALRKIGYKIFYSAHLNFKHFIPAYRTTLSYYKKLFLGFGMSYALLHAYSVNEKNLHFLKNDYRYICLRCLKNIACTVGCLLFRGYYFTFDKYRYINQLHLLYNNIGILKSFIKVKNLYKMQFSTQPLFRTHL